MPSVVGRLRYVESPAQAARPLGVLLLIHGFPLNARMWEPQLALSAAGWRVIAPILRGFDGGAGDPPAVSVDDYAADIVDLLDALHIDEAVVGGLSMGGYVAFAMFRLAPRYFSGLILADTRSQADTQEGVEGRKRMLALLAEKGPAAIADEMLPRLLGETTRLTKPGVEQSVRSMVLSNSPQAIAGAITALMTRPDSTPMLSSIHCPTLVVVGDEDTLTPPPLSKSLQEAIGGASLAVVPEAGHLSNLEQPDAFNGAVAQFLKRY